MRKHHTRWVALFGAATLSATGLVCLVGPAVANDKDTRGLDWPVVRQGVSSYSLDGYELAYLPPGLDRFGINASSTTDPKGNRQSQISWVQGPDQLYGRVAVVRSDRVQELDGLRESRYGHLPERGLEFLEPSEEFEHGAYLSRATGDMFWLEGPGVAIVTHLQPNRWDSDELVRMAESVVPEIDEASEDEGPEDEGPEDEGPEDEGPEEAPEDGTADNAVEEAVDGTPAVDDGAVAADLPDGVGSREVKECLIDRFVDFETGTTDLDRDDLAPDSGEFVEQALTQEDLTDAERDRLLATVWYYGTEADKTGATRHCADEFDMKSSDVESVLSEVAELIGQIVEEANQNLIEGMDQVSHAIGELNPPNRGTVVGLDPVGAEEWEELWASLPWSFEVDDF